MNFLMVNPHETIQNNLYLYGQFEANLSNLAAKLLLDLDKPNAVCDVGANLGSFCIPLAKKIRNTGQLIYSFECQTLVHQHLSTNIIANSLENQIVAEKIPVNDKRSSIRIPDLNIHSNNYIGSLSLKHEVIKKRMKMEGVAEPTADARGFDELISTTIDSYFKEIRVSLIKIDVEGMEIDVLHGSNRVIERDRPFIICESWHLPEFISLRRELLNFLLEKSYAVYLSNDDIAAIPVERITNRISEYCADYGFKRLRGTQVG